MLQRNPTHVHSRRFQPVSPLHPYLLVRYSGSACHLHCYQLPQCRSVVLGQRWRVYHRQLRPLQHFRADSPSVYRHLRHVTCSCNCRFNHSARDFYQHPHCHRCYSACCDHYGDFGLLHDHKHKHRHLDVPGHQPLYANRQLLPGHVFYSFGNNNPSAHVDC
jgi:hypothetical protein